MKKILFLVILLLGAMPAMATNDTLSVATCLYTGITPSFTSAADTVYVPNNGYTLIEVKNASGGEITVTVHSQIAAEEGQAASDLEVAVAATTGDKIIGPLKQGVWNDSAGYVMLTFSAKTSVTVNARKIPR